MMSCSMAVALLAASLSVYLLSWPVFNTCSLSSQGPLVTSKGLSLMML